MRVTDCTKMNGQTAVQLSMDDYLHADSCVSDGSMSPQNYIECRQRSLLNKKFMFFDAPDHVSARLFRKHGIHSWSEIEMGRDDEEYILLVCQIRRWDVKKFQAAMLELPNHMLILGHTDYDAVCRKWFDYFYDCRGEKTLKRWFCLPEQCRRCRFIDYSVMRPDGDHYFGCLKGLIPQAEDDECEGYLMNDGLNNKDQEGMGI